MAELQVKGLAELHKVLQNLPEELEKKVLRNALRAGANEFKKAAQAMEPAVRFAKLDTEAAPVQAAAHGIRSIPTMILFKDGREIARQSGAMPAGQIVQWVRDAARG